MKKILISSVVGATIGASIIGTKMNCLLEEKEKQSEKFRIMYQLMEHWMRIKQENESLEKYFLSYGYKKIAIYGMAEIGKLLLNELNGSSIEVEYGIDRNVNVTDLVKVYTPDDVLHQVDAVVVTAIAYFDDIERKLSEKIDCPIISLEDIVYEVV